MHSGQASLVLQRRVSGQEANIELHLPLSACWCILGIVRQQHRLWSKVNEDMMQHLQEVRLWTEK